MTAALRILPTPLPPVNLDGPRITVRHFDPTKQAALEAVAALIFHVDSDAVGPPLLPPPPPPLETTFAPDPCYACSGSGCDPEGYGCTMCNGHGTICDADLIDAMSDAEMDAYFETIARGDGWPTS